jgi:crotonobetainyl-CoA:carnitine CoA-transferase CaiB-like acyl-CoA transferase
MNSILEDLKVVELATVLAGPHVGMFFAELGAHVVKIENPKNPDVTRSWKLPLEPVDSPISAYFCSVNYQKKYLALDLKSEEGYTRLLELLKSADVVLMNFKHGDQEKMNLTDEFLLKLNPRLIIGKISGFGEDSDRVAYDLILQAETGYMSMNGEPGGQPVKMPVALIDVLAAHHLKEGLLLALMKRMKTGQGGVVSVSLYDAAVSSLVNQASNYLMKRHVPVKMGSLHPNIAPYGEIFKTKDERLVTFAIGSQTHFELMTKCLEVPHVALDKRFLNNQLRVQNRSELQLELQKAIANYYVNDLLEDMHALHIPCAEIKNLKQLFKEPEAQALVRSEKMNDKITKRVTSVAFKFQD